jgi:hypothetical protein
MMVSMDLQSWWVFFLAFYKQNELLFFFFFVILGFELRAFTLSHYTSPIFVMGFFEVGSRELFAWAGFEPCSPDLWVVRIIGVSHWHLVPSFVFWDRVLLCRPAGLELIIHLLYPPECWNHRHVPLCPATFLFMFLQCWGLIPGPCTCSC